MHFSSFFFPPPPSSFFFKPLISKLQPRIHSVSAPALPAAASPSASQLNEVNKLKGLLPSPAPSVPFAAFLLHLRPRLPPPLLLPPHPPPPPFLPSQLKRFLPLFLTFLPKKMFLIVIVARRKLWDFLPPFPRTELQLELRREEGQLCRQRGSVGGRQGERHGAERKDEGAPHRRGLDMCFRQCFFSHQSGGIFLDNAAAPGQGHRDHTGITTHHKE